MEFTVYGEGKSFKVAFFNRETFGNTLVGDDNVLAISNYNDAEIHLFSTDDRHFVELGSYEEHLHLNKCDGVKKNYDFILSYLRKNDIRICVFFGSGYPWHESFLDEVKRSAYVVSYFADDPEGANKTSRYYVGNFFYAFCGGIYFDQTRKIEDVYKEWGARKAKFIPLGVNPEKYEEPMNISGDRKIDLVYVGGCYFPKVLRMFRLKRHFGDRMVMYGRGWNESTSKIKTIILRFLKILYGVPYIEELPKDRLVGIYQNAKVGFNIHMSYGPSNQRMYELPANGVMQLCDCENGLRELYDIGKEVVAYYDIKDAIRKIEYYLEHDEERSRIALRGYRKVMDNYRLEESFAVLFGEIRNDMDTSTFKVIR